MASRNRLVSKAYNEMSKENPDFEKAFFWLRKAAEKKDSEALYAIGTWYLHGRYVKRNPKTAVDYFLKAIEGEYKDAYYDLGLCYEKGVGITKNKSEAFKCYLHAALLGEKQSIYEVGRCYYYGLGIEKNVEIAKIWLNQAKMLGIS